MEGDDPYAGPTDQQNDNENLTKTRQGADDAIPSHLLLVSKPVKQMMSDREKSKVA